MLVRRGGGGLREEGEKGILVLGEAFGGDELGEDVVEGEPHDIADDGVDEGIFVIGQHVTAAGVAVQSGEPARLAHAELAGDVGLGQPRAGSHGGAGGHRGVGIAVLHAGRVHEPGPGVEVAVDPEPGRGLHAVGHQRHHGVGPGLDPTDCHRGAPGLSGVADVLDDLGRVPEQLVDDGQDRLDLGRFR